MKDLAKLAKEIKMIHVQKQCMNFIERAVDNLDIKVFDFDAVREAIHDFTLGFNCQEFTEQLENNLIPMYAIVIDTEGLTYDDDSEELQVGEPVRIIKYLPDNFQVLIVSLNTGIDHVIDTDRIEKFK